MMKCDIATWHVSMSANNVQQRLKPTVWKNEGFKHKAKVQSKGAKTKNKLLYLER